MKRLQNRCLVLLSSLLVAVTAHAQSGAAAFPSRPVTLIVPFVAGGTITTLEARLYAQKLSEQLGGRTFLVDFKPGAGGAIGAAFVAKAPADGYTVLVASGAFVLVPALSKTPSYDPVKDFTPITLMSTRTNLLVVSNSMPVNSLKEYIAFARANPGGINFATPGAGSGPHLGGAWLHKATGTSVTFVHYKGTAPIPTDIIAGRVNATVGSYAALGALVNSGKLRLLAVTGEDRIDLLPNAPTVAEQGVTGYNYSNWLGIVAPAGTPASIVDLLAAELNKVAKNPEVNKLLAAENSQSTPGSTPQKFKTLIASETSRWTEIVREAGIEVDE